MYPKIKFIAKNWSDLCNFYSTMIFLNFCLRKYFLIFFAEFKLLIFHNNIVKISEKLIKQNLLKICPQVTYPTNFCIICIHFTMGPASVAQLDAPSDWRPGGRGFDPRRGRQHSFVEIDHEIFSTVILSLPLIQEGQLSVSGERMCTLLVNRLEN